MYTIGVWGDSITWGAYDQQEGGWVRRLRRLRDNNFTLGPGYDGGPSVYNLGIWGDKVADVLRRIELEYAARRPDMVILAIGLNDSPHSSHPHGTPLDEFKSLYRGLVEKVKQHTDSVILVGPTNVIDAHPRNRGYVNEHIEPYARAIQAIAEEQKIIYVDVFGLMTADDLGVDGVHPLASGHEKIYSNVKEALA